MLNVQEGALDMLKAGICKKTIPTLYSKLPFYFIFFNFTCEDLLLHF